MLVTESGGLYFMSLNPASPKFLDKLLQCLPFLLTSLSKCVC